jgi:hypothetical protein
VFRSFMWSESANVSLYLGRGEEGVSMGSVNSNGAYIEFRPHERRFLWKAMQEKLVEMLESGAETPPADGGRR